MSVAAVHTASVLVVQARAQTREVIFDALAGRNCDVAVAVDTDTGLEFALNHRVDVVVFDVALTDGFNALAQIHAAKPHLPLIVLTALDDLESRLAGLEAGAVDYVTLPFEPAEIAARIAAHLRLASAAREARLSGGGIDVDLIHQTVTHLGEPIHLTQMEFRLLTYLMRRPGQTTSRQDILRDAWGIAPDPRGNLVDVYIGYLRRKLRGHYGDADMPIQTVRSVGYRFVDGGS